MPVKRITNKSQTLAGIDKEIKSLEKDARRWWMVKMKAAAMHHKCKKEISKLRATRNQVEGIQ